MENRRQLSLLTVFLWSKRFLIFASGKVRANPGVARRSHGIES